MWLYFRFPSSLLMVDEMLPARGILISEETERYWALPFGRNVAATLSRRRPGQMPSHGGRTINLHDLQTRRVRPFVHNARETLHQFVTELWVLVAFAPKADSVQ